jgi:DNA-binding transcriptional ArsR family regulator
MEELAKSFEDLQQRLEHLEAKVQKLEESRNLVTMEDGRKEPWEVVEIEKVMKKWYAAVGEPVIVSATRDKQGGWVNTSPIKALTQLPMDKVVFLLSPFSSEQRLKILLLLHEYPRSSTDLSNATGLEGGPLYHHIEELIEAKYMEKVYKGKYCLTDIGRWALFNVLSTAQHLINFPGGRGLEPEPEPEEKADG